MSLQAKTADIIFAWENAFKLKQQRKNVAFRFFTF